MTDSPSDSDRYEANGLGRNSSRSYRDSLRKAAESPDRSPVQRAAALKRLTKLGAGSKTARRRLEHATDPVERVEALRTLAVRAAPGEFFLLCLNTALDETEAAAMRDEAAGWLLRGETETRVGAVRLRNLLEDGLWDSSGMLDAFRMRGSRRGEISRAFRRVCRKRLRSRHARFAHSGPDDVMVTASRGCGTVAVTLMPDAGFHGDHQFNLKLRIPVLTQPHSTGHRVTLDLISPTNPDVRSQTDEIVVVAFGDYSTRGRIQRWDDKLLIEAEFPSFGTKRTMEIQAPDLGLFFIADSSPIWAEHSGRHTD